MSFVSVNDAAGRRPSSIAEGNINWLGNFDQCMKQKATYEEYPRLPGVHDFDANFCLTFRFVSEEAGMVVRDLNSVTNH